jgi:carbamoyltransferase
VNTFLAEVRRGETQRLDRAAQLGLDHHDLLDLPLATQQQRVRTCLEAVAASLPDAAALPRHHVPHHTAHAASAFLLAPVTEALVLTLDGKGDDLSGSVHHGHNAMLTPRLSVNALSSLGHLYSAFTVACGLRPQRDEGKLMAMASFGRIHDRLRHWLGRTVTLDRTTGGIIGGLNAGLVLGPYPDRVPADHNDLVRRLIEGIAVEDAAATVQGFLEDFVCEFAAHHLRE